MDSKYTFIEQAKILRVFELINLLANTKSTIEKLAMSLDQTPRTIYRYLNLLEEVGFQILSTKKRVGGVLYYMGTDYYPVFVSCFREDVWKIKNRINENPQQTLKRELREQEMEVSNG